MRMVMPRPVHALAFIMILVWVPLAGGQESTSEADRTGIFDHHFESPTATFGLRYILHNLESDVEARRHFLDGELLSSLQGRFGQRLYYSLSPWVRFDNAHRSEPGFEFYERSSVRPLITLKEAFAAWYGDVYEITVGKKIFSWGVGEGLRPADNLNPYDFLDVPAAEKIGIPACSIFRYGEQLNVQLVLAPVFVPGRLPATDNRWAFRDAEAMERIHETFGDWYSLADGGQVLPVTTMHNAQFAFKLDSSTLLTGWDLALSCYRGYYAYGVMFLESVVFPPAVPGGGIQPPILTIRRVYPEYREIAASISTTVDNWELHAEGAYHHTLDREMDDSFLEYVAGFNHTIYTTGLPLLQEVRGSIEYAGIGVTRERPSDSLYSGAGFGRGLTNSLLANLLLLFTDDTRCELVGAVNLDPGDGLAWISLSRRMSDHITLEAGYQFFEGPRNSFFGGWDDNDRFVLRIIGNI
jgi:hypothetical protein